MTGHVATLLEHDIRTEVSFSEFMGILKGKTAIKLLKSYPKLKMKPYWCNHFLAQSYFVHTVGLEEEMIRRYVKYQEDEERTAEQDRQYFTLS